MSQTDTMAAGSQRIISREELLQLKKEMNARALTRRRVRTGTLLVANIIMAVVILLPLLYAISIAFMPSGELFTTDLNLFPKNPTIPFTDCCIIRITNTAPTTPPRPLYIRIRLAS